MAETHQMATPLPPSTPPSFVASLASASAHARSIPAHVLPTLTHLTYRDYDEVYEPSDDTFLLLDVVSYDLSHSISRRSQREGREEEEEVVVEIGCGSGVNMAAVAAMLGCRARV